MWRWICFIVPILDPCTLSNTFNDALLTMRENLQELLFKVIKLSRGKSSTQASTLLSSMLHFIYESRVRILNVLQLCLFCILGRLQPPSSVSRASLSARRLAHRLSPLYPHLHGHHQPRSLRSSSASLQEDDPGDWRQLSECVFWTTGWESQYFQL